MGENEFLVEVEPQRPVEQPTDDSQDNGNTMTETTDSDGKATFELPYDDYTVVIHKEGYAKKTQEVAFRSNHKNFTIALNKSSGTITATCIDGEGNPKEGLYVALSTGGIIDPQTDTLCANITDENGTCTLKEMDWTANPPIADADAIITNGAYHITVFKDDEPLTDKEITVLGDTIVEPISLEGIYLVTYKTPNGDEEGHMYKREDAHQDNRQEYLLYTIHTSTFIWLSDTAIFDGTTQNQVYGSSTGEWNQKYIIGSPV